MYTTLHMRTTGNDRAELSNWNVLVSRIPNGLDVIIGHTHVNL